MFYVENAKHKTQHKTTAALFYNTMVVPSSKRRRPPKAKSHTRWEVVCLIVLSVFGVVYWLDNPDIQSHFPTQEDPQPNNIQEQCRASCKATLSKNGYTIPNKNPERSASLSSSAVSAMLNLMEVDEQNYLNMKSTALNVSLFDLHETMTNLRHGVLNDGDETLEALKSRPRRLPPLIDELVGTLDNDFEALHLSQNWHGQRKLIRRLDAEDKEKLGEITKKGWKNISLGEDPVAQIAAAAAAALWSDHNGRGGNSLRMKVVNDEWEEALRWISSWGGQHSESLKQSTHHERKTDIENIDGAQRKHRRNFDSTHRQKAHMNRFKADNEIDFERFYEVCIDRCIGDDGVNRFRGHKTGESFDITTNKLNVGSTTGVYQLFSTLTSKIKVVCSMHSIFRDRMHVTTVWGLIGIMLSSIGVWLRNLIDRRKQTSCYQSLLEEETRLASTSTPRTKHQYNLTKKTSSKKKSRRKRRDTQNNPKEQNSNSNPPSFDEESVSSDASMDRRFVEGHYLKTFGDQGSKEGNTTVSTFHTYEVELEEKLDPVDIPTSSSTSMKGKAKMMKHQRRNEYSPMRSDARGQYMKRYDSHHSKKFKSHSSRHRINQSNNSRNYAIKSAIHAPTTEQREEAAMKLRAYQQAQIQKMIDSSRRIAGLQMKPDYYKTSEQVSSDTANTNNHETNHTYPPPGFTSVTKVKDPEYDCEQNDASLLISNLLDEDDDEQLSSTCSSTINTKKSSFQSSQIQPVPFGDLLIGTFSAINASSSEASISNPWRHESLDCSTITSQVSTPSHTPMHNVSSLASVSSDLLMKDANSCLQVSAQAFSPGVAREYEEKAKIW